MKILVASDSFKGTMSSEKVGEIIKSELKNHQVDVLTISDGGEGIIEAFEKVLSFKKIKLNIQGPLKENLSGYYLLTNDHVAVIESAVGCGLALVSKEKRNPLKTSTYGVGLLIKDAIKRGAKKLIVGIGGTSTNDGGIGMLEALGVLFYDKHHQLLRDVSGENLSQIHVIETSTFDEFVAEVKFDIACDVSNPLLGSAGATYTFGPQKGADLPMCKALEAGMSHYAKLVEKHYNIEGATIPGTGAAGGLGFCFVTFFKGHLISGIDLMLNTLGFDEIVKKYDLVITGEGKMDKQTSLGKVPLGILKRTEKQEINTIAVCGVCEHKPEAFKQVFSIVPSVASMEASMSRPEKFLSKLIVTQVKAWIDSDL